MANLYYLHLGTCGEIDSQTKIVDKSVHPMIIEDVGLEFSDWPHDDMFQSWPAIFATRRLVAKIIHEKYSGIDYKETSRVTPDHNFKAFYPNFYPDKYCWLNIYGEIDKDDFSLYNRLYLVVSEKALNFLRDNHVTHADADRINVPLSEYFNSERKNFWIDLEREKLKEKGLFR